MSQSGNTAHRPSIASAKATWIRMARRDLEPLPHPSKTWTFVDVDPDQFRKAANDPPDICGVDISRSTLSKAIANGVIKRVRKPVVTGHGRRRVFRTDETSYAYLHEKLAESAANDGCMPCCGYDGFANERGLEVDGESAVRCTDCGAAVAKSEVRL